MLPLEFGINDASDVESSCFLMMSNQIELFFGNSLLIKFQGTLWRPYSGRNFLKIDAFTKRLDSD